MSTYALNGQDYRLCELSAISGVDATTIRGRLKRGWSVAEAIRPVEGLELYTLAVRRDFFSELVVQQAAALKAAMKGD